MQILLYPTKTEIAQALQRPVLDYPSLEKKVAEVLSDIKQQGDAAVHKYTQLFDQVNCPNLAVTPSEIDEALELVDEALKEAIAVAIGNITTFHQSQQRSIEKVETMPGVTCWQKSVGIDKVGLYVPGGTAPLFSTVLMLGIPAKLAGCKEIILCSPPNKEGKLHPAILYAAHQVGITAIYKVGGIQAVGAMAYGTATIPNVYKIFGPGNQYFTAAKQLVSREGIAIDLPAGPSEVAVMADKSANPSFIAADLLSQAEHGVDSQVILVIDAEDLVAPVLAQIEEQLAVLPRKELAKKCLENSKILVCRTQDDMIQLMNDYAPEHLIISMTNYMDIAEKITNAGSVFLGHLTPESAGDYASGTNHTLPTHGYAKAYSGVNMDSFVKKITFQEITPTGLQHIGKSIELMAATEQLEAHKHAVTIRLNTLTKA